LHQNECGNAQHEKGKVGMKDDVHPFMSSEPEGSD